MSEPVDRAADLAADSVVTRIGDSEYRADLPASWNFLTPSGGVLHTVALRAMVAELDDPAYQPISSTVIFCRPVPAGALTVVVELLRRGRNAAQLRAQLYAETDGPPGLELSATFAKPRSGPAAVDADFPDVPMPGEAPEASEPHPKNPHTRLSFFQNFDVRMALGTRWWLPEHRAGRSECARWFRYRVPQRRADGSIDPLALPPIADTMPAALIQKLGPGGPRFFAPSLDLTVHFLEPTECDWLLVLSRVPKAWDGYAQASFEIWSEEKRLICTGGQTMLLRLRD